jgi:hypothetical protein
VLGQNKTVPGYFFMKKWIIFVLLLVCAMAWGQILSRDPKTSDAEKAAIISADGAKTAAVNSANGVERAATITANATQSAATNTLIVSGIAGVIAVISAVLNYKNWQSTKLSMEQSQKQFDARLEAERLENDRKDELARNIQTDDRSENERKAQQANLAVIVERHENERKAQQARFIDVQNRLSATNESERVNAVHSLIDLAKELNPGPIDGVVPSEKNNPLFKPVVRRVASLLVLEESDAVRAAALATIKPLIEFSRDEYKHCDETNFAQPLTRFLIEKIADANRDAYKQWVTAWAQFVGAARVVEGVYDPDDDDLKEMGFQVRRKIVVDYSAENWSTQASKERDIRRERLMGGIFQESRDEPEDRFCENWLLWKTALSLCPFIPTTVKNSENLTVDFMLDASDREEFKIEMSIHSQLIETLSDENKAEEKREMRKRLRLNSQRLISTRDAVSVSLKNRKITKALLPFHYRTRPEETDRQISFDAFWISNGRQSNRYFVNLSLTCLVGAYLNMAQIFDASLSNAQFQGANLCYAQFPSADMSRAHFHGADLRNAQFPGADLRASQFPNADLSYAQFPGAIIFDAQFPGADLSRAQFPGAKFCGAKFIDADLSNAQFSDAKFSLDAVPWLEANKDATTKYREECYCVAFLGAQIPWPNAESQDAPLNVDVVPSPQEDSEPS